MDTLGADLLLLAIDPRSGGVRLEHQLRFGLMGSELVRLAALARVDIVHDRIVVTEPATTTTGDQELDVALASIATARRPPKPANWVARPRREITGSYLGRLSAAGVIERTSAMRVRWRIADEAAASSARARLDAIALRSGQVDAEQAAYAGLVHAVGLDHVLYRGWGNRDVRKRLQQIAKGQWTAGAVSDAVSASRAAQQAAMNAATQAAMQAATNAAVQAATAAAAAASQPIQ